MVPDVFNACSKLFVDGNVSVDALCVSNSLLVGRGAKSVDSHKPQQRNGR